MARKSRLDAWNNRQRQKGYTPHKAEQARLDRLDDGGHFARVQKEVFPDAELRGALQMKGERVFDRLGFIDRGSVTGRIHDRLPLTEWFEELTRPIDRPVLAIFGGPGDNRLTDLPVFLSPTVRNRDIAFDLAGADYGPIEERMLSFAFVKNGVVINVPRRGDDAPDAPGDWRAHIAPVALARCVDTLADGAALTCRIVTVGGATALLKPADVRFELTGAAHFINFLGVVTFLDLSGTHSSGETMIAKLARTDLTSVEYAAIEREVFGARREPLSMDVPTDVPIVLVTRTPLRGGAPEAIGWMHLDEYEASVPHLVENFEKTVKPLLHSTVTQ